MTAKIYYERWTAAGDQLLLVDNRNGIYTGLLENQDLKRHMCDRSVGIGANGIMEFRATPNTEYLYEIVMHTGLGYTGPVPLCGNGSRCAVAYACTHGIVPREKWARFAFLAADGKHEATFREDVVEEKHDVIITMRDMHGVQWVTEKDFFADPGTAHFVKFIEPGTLQSINIDADGRQINRAQQGLAPKKFVLVDWVEDRADGLYARCYDTGVDAEIYACGTASVAIATCHVILKDEPDGVKEKVIHWPGGDVTVGLERHGAGFSNITLQSVVSKECQGTFNVR